MHFLHYEKLRSTRTLDLLGMWPVCACSTQGAGRRKCMDASEIHKFSTITHSLIAFEDFLGSSIAPQVMPPWTPWIFFGFDPFRQLCTIHRAALTAKKKTGKCRKEEKKPIYYPQVVMRKSGKQVECTGAVLAPKWVDFSSFIPILYSVVFLLVRPKNDNVSDYM